MRARCIWDARKVHPERAQDSSELRAGHVWDAYERYLGAELYRMHENIIFLSISYGSVVLIIKVWSIWPKNITQK